jgi:predicted transcriptional regulator
MDTPNHPTETPKVARRGIKRSDSVKIRLAPAIVERLDALSAAYGVPRATLCSVAIGQFLASSERGLAMVDKIADTVGGDVGDQMKLFMAALGKEA